MPDVRLEPLSEAHLDHLAALVADPDTLRHTRIPEPPPADFPRTWLARYEAGARDGTAAGFAAVDGDGRFVGVGVAPTIDREAGTLELGYIVAPEHRGNGLAGAILRALTTWAFEEAGAQRVELIINDDNVPSQRVAERCGYTHEGVMRSVHLKQGRRVDAGLWSRLPSDR